MQQLNISLAVHVPEEYVLIKKVDLQELEDQSLRGVTWGMKKLEEKMNKKRQWIERNVLYPPHFKRILDTENGGFVHYPEASGQPWSFQANKMADFLDKYFGEIYRGK